MREQIAAWQSDVERNRKALTYRRGPGFLVITDTRTTLPAPARYQPDAVEAATYLACQDIATIDSIAADVERVLHAPIADTKLRDILTAFIDAHLVVEDGGKYLAIALPAAANWGRTVGTEGNAGSCPARQAAGGGMLAPVRP